jgi:hypothetical protein
MALQVQSHQANLLDSLHLLNQHLLDSDMDLPLRGDKNGKIEALDE